MKILVFACVACLALSGCASDQSRLQTRIDLLEMKCDSLQKQVDQLADASINNSQAVEKNSAAISSLAHTVEITTKRK